MDEQEKYQELSHADRKVKQYEAMSKAKKEGKKISFAFISKTDPDKAYEQIQQMIREADASD